MGNASLKHWSSLKRIKECCETNKVNLNREERDWLSQTKDSLLRRSAISFQAAFLSSNAFTASTTRRSHSFVNLGAEGMDGQLLCDNDNRAMKIDYEERLWTTGDFF